ncbi:MAG: hypothetical protein E7331_10725 [Clostridiales bacterium]|nr:hypothetical protein [Clostridiales bacterium]
MIQKGREDFWTMVSVIGIQKRIILSTAAYSLIRKTTPGADPENTHSLPLSERPLHFFRRDDESRRLGRAAKGSLPPFPPDLKKSTA